MEYSFDWSWFGIGVLILLAGVALTIWYRQLADMFGSGVVSYERFRLWGLIGCLLGFVVILNLHSLLLNWFFGLLFGKS